MSTPNQLAPELLSSSALNPWPGGVSSPRLQMFYSMLTQAPHTVGANPPRTFTGLESKYGEFTLGVKTEYDTHVIRRFPRYPGGMGIHSIKENPETLLLVEVDIPQDDGTIRKELDIISVPTHDTMHQSFGIKYNVDTNELRNDYIPAGTTLAQSPAIDKDGNYCYGMDVPVALMNIPEVGEDGEVASESYCREATTMGMMSYQFSFGKRKFPLNLYGSGSHYKICPDIGEEVGEDGILVAFREYNERLAPISMGVDALRQYINGDDDPIITTPGARVIDIIVHHDRRLKAGIKGRHMVTPVEMTEQPEKYLQSMETFYRNLLTEYNRLKTSRHGNIRISPRLHRLLVEAIAMTAGNNKRRMSTTFRSTPLDEWRMEVTVAYPIVPTIGSKLAGRHGDKGIIVAIRPDEEMPVDKNGVRAKLIRNGFSTLARMNPSRLIEQYVNAASDNMMINLYKRQEAGEPIEALEDALLDYYGLISPKMKEAMSTPEGRLIPGHLERVMSKGIHGIHVFIPTDNERTQMEIIRNLKNKYPALNDVVTYRGMSGEFKPTSGPVIIGGMYIMMLEKTGRDWSGVAASKLSLFGIPAKLTNADRFSSPGRHQPIRFGESEFRIFTSAVGSKETAHVAERSLNPRLRKALFERILREDKPLAQASLAERDQIPGSTNRIMELVKSGGQVGGWQLCRAEC